VEWGVVREKREVADEFGAAYRRYAARVPAFFPRMGAKLTAE
jgi:protein-S-isoprenylcysteine O-methyltransferase Ste14